MTLQILGRSRRHARDSHSDDEYEAAYHAYIQACQPAVPQPRSRHQTQNGSACRRSAINRVILAPILRHRAPTGTGPDRRGRANKVRCCHVRVLANVQPTIGYGPNRTNPVAPHPKSLGSGSVRTTSDTAYARLNVLRMSLRRFEETS